MRRFCEEEKSIFISQLAVISQSREIASRSRDETWGVYLRKGAPYRKRKKKEKQAGCAQPEMAAEDMKRRKKIGRGQEAQRVYL